MIDTTKTKNTKKQDLINKEIAFISKQILDLKDDFLSQRLKKIFYFKSNLLSTLKNSKNDLELFFKNLSKGKLTVYNNVEKI